MNKILSCGIIITNGYKMLIGHVTNSDHWTIPKGKKEINESPSEAACRETFEECGVSIDISNLLDLGVFYYKPNKDLHIFMYTVKNLPIIEDLKCSSFTKLGFPEIDSYEIISILDYDKYMNSNMTRILDEIYGRIR